MPPAEDTIKGAQALAAAAKQPKVQHGLLILAVVVLVGMVIFERWVNVASAAERFTKADQAVYSEKIETRIRALEDEKIRLNGTITSLEKEMANMVKTIEVTNFYLAEIAKREGVRVPPQAGGSK